MISRIPGALLALVLLGPQVACAPRFPDPARFEEEIARFAEQDRLRPPPAGGIVLTGSSSIARWNDSAAAALAPLTVIPRGFGGSVMHDLLHYLDRVVLVYQPRAVVIYEGDNDTGGSPRIPNEAVLSDLREIIARIHARLPQARIYLLAVKPSVARRARWKVARQLSDEYRRIAAADPQVHFVDVATPLLDAEGAARTDVFVADGLHLNERGNAIWGATIKAALLPLEGPFEPRP